MSVFNLNTGVSNPFSGYSSIQAQAQALGIPVSAITSTASSLTSNIQQSIGTLVGSSSIANKDMRLVIAPAGASLSSSSTTSTASQPVVFNTSQLVQHQGGGSQTSNINSTPSSSSSGVPTGNGYYSGILAPLLVTNGVLFPYSPAISFSQDVEYQLVGGGLVHTNQDYNAYQRTPSVKLTIEGKFTIQNQYEGLYMLAVIHFFRTVSKMYFGEAAANAGTAGLPPPILILNGYGTYMFNNLPCLLTTHSFSYTDDVDTIDIADSSGGITKLPSLLDLTIGLTVQQTPYNMSTVFDLNAFRSGALMKNGGWI
jgi:hypothetical protein